MRMSDEELRRRVRRVVRLPLPGRVRTVDQQTLRAALDSILEGEPAARVKLFHPYGFISRALPGMEVLVVPIGGSSANLAYVGSNDSEFRPQDLEEGEGGLYSDEGDTVLLRRGKRIEIKSDGTITIDAQQLVEILGPLIEAKAVGAVQALCNEVFLARYNGHKHAPGGSPPEPEDQAVIGTDTTSVFKAE